jgi:hypothetical protein
MVNFSNKMQLMNYVGYQGIFESAGHKLNETGGVMLWKLNAALPSVVWQIYDWYLEPNAGYYAMQNAVEPVHIQFNQDDSTAAVINRRHRGTGNLTADVAIYNTNSKLLKSIHTEHIQLDSAGTVEAVPLKDALKGIKEMVFVVLNLKNAGGKLISHNVYWMSRRNDFRALNKMAGTKLETQVLSSEKGKSEDKWTLQITNNSAKVAFFVRPQLIKDGDEVMPSYWTKNYFTLAPHEHVTLSVSAPVAKLGTGALTLLVEGWNVEKKTISLSAK